MKPTVRNWMAVLLSLFLFQWAQGMCVRCCRAPPKERKFIEEYGFDMRFNLLGMGMMTDDEPKFAGISIPKCASGSQGAFLYSEPNAANTRLRNNNLYKNDLTEYLIYVFVRDPVKRLLSAYHTIKTRWVHAGCGDFDWEEHTRRIVEPHEWDLNCSRGEMEYRHLVSQSAYITDWRTGIPFDIRFVGHVESLDYDWNVLNMFGLNSSLSDRSHKQPNHIEASQWLEWLEHEAPWELRSMICYHIAPDCCCFGYDLPEWCDDIPMDFDTTWSFISPPN